MPTSCYACYITVSNVVSGNTVKADHHIGTIRTRSGNAPSIEAIIRKARRQGMLAKGRLVRCWSSPVAGGKP